MIRFGFGWRALVMASAVVAPSLFAATYFIDPGSGAMTGDGSAQKPWSTLEAVMAAKKVFRAGDVLILRNGFHGRPVVRGLNEKSPISILPADGAHPQLASLTFKTAANWIVSGLAITPEGVPAGKTRTQSLVMIGSDCRDITLSHCEISSAKSIAGWSENDWLARSISGISCSGAHCTIADNTLRNVRFGIVLGRDARDSVVSRNLVQDFMSDGLRGLADHCVFEGNTVKNCYKIDDNHDDGFQSWSGGEGGVKVGGGVVKGVILRGNTFISYTDPAQPFKSAMQGIGCFDGMFEDWIVENNLVVTDMWHGIAFYGAKNCRIVNNTVVKNPIDAAPRTPWIQISPHKHGAKSTGNIVRNNLVQTLNVPADSADADHNVVMKAPAAVFADFQHFDFHLKPESAAVDAGSEMDAPKSDLDGKARTPPPDVGAYELVSK
jgi:hypothetical protein